ncbi:Mov34/MPN/PAD-1 family protein (plasmid) [Ralstonia wenshanensis]|uniref:Mov34/MPN/PAD-1 family protein n=1 Tax=Ralstonia wenshanensis TaxID=2842456 RepID=UPI001E2D39BB|nr:Mov34/MPN/PAD-1 family protein [Ralstonia wenshanensis]UGS88497.1 Mov34/MPN/PAD-1 family protein [Ralstonia wenshanensis]
MPESLILRHPFNEDARILIEPSVLAALMLFRQTSVAAPESGGILLGYRRGMHLHVSTMTTPQPGDTQHRYGFQRQAQQHQKIALEQWKAEHETMDYIGEWHTHPETNPTPSSIDTREWRKICHARSEPMVFLIAGTRNMLWAGVGRGHALRGVAVQVT